MVSPSNGVRWKEPAIVIGILSLVIALLAFGRDLFGFELFTQAQDPPQPAMTSNLPASTNSPTPDAPSPKSTLSGTPLTDYTPKVGGGWVRRPAHTQATLDMACATNTDGDMYRAVQYAIPRRYAAFRTRVAPSDVMDDVQMDIRVDNVVRAKTTLRPNQPHAEMSTTVTGGSTLELRLTCATPGGKVTLSNAMLTN
jgi:hypothetical protein